MIKLIITGHGHFATGLQSAVELIAGKQEHVEFVDFVSGMSQDEYKDAFLKALGNEYDVLVLCDLLGGTPFKVTSELLEEMKDIHMNVIAGVNLTMVMEALFARYNLSLEELVDMLKVTGKSGILDTVSMLLEDESDEELESGF